MIALVLVGGLVAPGSPVGADPAGVPHLPDIKTKRPTDAFIDPSGESGGKELRFTNTLWNRGAGPLELYAVNDDATEMTVAHQRIFTHNASGDPVVYDDNVVGEFTFHPFHNHWHFEGFARYQIREVTSNGGVGALLRESEKISFCIIPTTPVTNSIDHAGWGLNNGYNCGENNKQGLPVGWGDQYYYGLNGQYVPIAGLADGVYWLKSKADFENRLDEELENNNAKRVKIRITGNTVECLPTPC
jgi:hypothetical protein